MRVSVAIVLAGAALLGAVLFLMANTGSPCGFFMVLFWPAGFWLWRQLRDWMAEAKLARQRARDEAIAEIFRRADGLSSRYVLFLRSYARPDDDAFEVCLAEAVEGYGPLVALGPDPTFGAAKLPFSTDWQSTVALLIESAPLVIVVPAASPGARWEIEQTWRSEKALYVMPPQTLAMNSGFRGASEMEQRWADIAHELRRAGIELPEYQECGAMWSGAPEQLQRPTWLEQRLGFSWFARRAIAEVLHARGACRRPARP